MTPARPGNSTAAFSWLLAARGAAFGRALGSGLAALVWLSFSLGWRALSLPDEGRYVGVAWEMLRSGDWLVPTQNGLPFFHKPPLFYWLTAASLETFGTHPAAARLAPLLAAAVAAFVLYRVARYWLGPRLAGWTLVVLLTEPFFFGAAQFANLDMLVAACIAIAILLAAHGALRFESGLPHRPAILGAWAAMAFGVLAKGLIGAVLPVLVIVAWLLVTRRYRVARRLVSAGGILLFAAICVPWFLAVQARYPGFAHFFFVYQHFERFTSGGFNNVQPWWFFLLVLPALTLPWSPWLLRSAWRKRAGEPAEAATWRQLMWVWLAVVVGFFSIPQSKPIGYLMPALFPVAALCAEAICFGRRAGAGRTRALLAPACALIAVLICVATLAWYALAPGRDNVAIARSLREHRAAADPVVFVDNYFFDIPMLAGLAAPVPVVSDWSDPEIARRDNWRRELAEGQLFAPALTSRLLVDSSHGLAPRCDGLPTWVVAGNDDPRQIATIAGATRIERFARASLWRIAPGACSFARDP